MSEFLTRSIATPAVEGRTLYGLAVPFDTPAVVADPPSFRPYKEAFARSAFTQTLKSRAAFQVFSLHPEQVGPKMPLGRVEFEVRSDGLHFAAPLSATREADEVLALVSDGVPLGASLSFRAIKGKSLERAGVTVRTEVAIRNLAIVPEPAYAEAVVAGVRSAEVGFVRLEASRKKALLLFARSW